MNSISTQTFDCFQVHNVSDDYSFIHVKIENKPCFYGKLFDYFFSEDKLIQYCENISNLKFRPTKQNYVTLYKNLQKYIDSRNIEKDMAEIDEILHAVLKEELKFEDKDNKTIIGLDKMGKIGEYMFSCILSDYFKFDCIIPKIQLLTDKNMNVYGIDTLFYSSVNNLLLFGESKITLNLDNGIALINKSLSEYEQQIKEEFSLVLSNRFYASQLNIFNDKYGAIAASCCEIEDFIKYAKIEKIGIPIFIAHGVELCEKEILTKISKIKRNSILGLPTVYYIISIPIVDKNKLIALFTKKIKEQIEYYHDEATK